MNQLDETLLKTAHQRTHSSVFIAEQFEIIVSHCVHVSSLNGAVHISIFAFHVCAFIPKQAA